MLPARTLYAFALTREAKPFCSRCLDARTAIIGTGPRSSANAIAKAIASERPEAIVVAGYAGALVPKLHVGDIVVATGIVETRSETSLLSPLSRLCGRGAGGEGFFFDAGVDENQITLTPNPSPAKPGEGDRSSQACGSHRDSQRHRVRQGRILSADRIIGHPAEKRSLAQQFQAVAVDMESAAVARVCIEHHIPWAAVRVISDDIDTELSAELIELVSGGSVSIRKTLAAVLRQPSLLAEFRRLARDTRIAAANLAEYLAAIRR